ESMKDVVVIAATNRPGLIDRALLRTGRFDRFVFIDAPNADSRKEIFEIYLADMPLDDDVSIDSLVKTTEFFVGGDIEALCREAGMRALREDLDVEKVSMKHFEAAQKQLHPSVTAEMIEAYKKMNSELRKTDVESQKATYFA
ncbi:MAG: AAA family ATPase, partial [Candidatus Thorarchaeota archaeon]